MTKLTKPVQRETALVVQGRVVLITLREGGRVIEFRRKGTRSVFRTTVEATFWAAAKNSMEAHT